MYNYYDGTIAKVVGKVLEDECEVPLLCRTSFAQVSAVVCVCKTVIGHSNTDVMMSEV